jgi:acetyltransferase
MCFIDYSREMALVAEGKNPKTGSREILGVGRLIKAHGTNEGEFAVIVSDRRQRCGLGTEMLRRLIEIGREEKLARITGDVLPENTGMLRVCERLGFRLPYSVEQGILKAEMVL